MIYLHIGLPKTGTTSIQAGLEAIEALLRSRKYLYPKAARQLGGHHRLVHHPADSKYNQVNQSELAELIKEIQEFKKEVPKGHIIISSEALITLRFRIEVLVRALQGIDEVICLVYLRRQDSFLRSFWSMDVARQKTSLNINKWAQKAVEEGTFKILDFYQILTQIQQVDPKMKMKVLLYEAEKERGLFKSFLMNIGLDKIRKIKSPEQRNISDTVITSELYRRYCNRFFDELSKQELIEMLPILRQMSIEGKWKGAIKGKTFFDRQTYLAIRAKYEARNMACIKEYVDDSYNSLFLLFEQYEPGKYFQMAENQFIKSIDKTRLHTYISSKRATSSS